MDSAKSMVETNMTNNPTVNLEDLLDMIDYEDLEWAIEYLKSRYQSWQNWLSMPS